MWIFHRLSRSYRSHIGKSHRIYSIILAISLPFIELGFSTFLKKGSTSNTLLSNLSKYWSESSTIGFNINFSELLELRYVFKCFILLNAVYFSFAMMTVQFTISSSQKIHVLDCSSSSNKSGILRDESLDKSSCASDITQDTSFISSVLYVCFRCIWNIKTKLEI